MLNNSFISALDIGSSKISAILAEFQRKRIARIFFESLPVKGVKNGVILDSIALLDCIGKTLKNLRAKSGINFKSVCVNLSGLDLATRHSRAIIPLAERGNKVITLYDIRKVNEQARILGSSLEEEIIHQIPASYNIDTGNNILNPIGLYSHKLEADLYLVCAKLSAVQNLARAVHQAGFDIKNLVFSGLATSRAVFGDEIKEGVHVLCDVGSDITELLIFKDGLLRDIEILPIGGSNLTSSLAEELKIPVELAEDIKRSSGIVGDFSFVSDDKEVLFKKNNVYRPIKQKEVCLILNDRAVSICKIIKESLEKKVEINSINSFVACGRAVMLEGFLEMLENNIGVSVRPAHLVSCDAISLVRDNENLAGHKFLNYCTALGIIYDSLLDKHLPVLPVSNQPVVRNPFVKAINKVKDVYQEYF